MILPVANSPTRQGTRFIKNSLSGTDDRVKEFNGVFDKLMQEFRDSAIGNTLVVVHRIWGLLTLAHHSGRLGPH